MNIREQVAKQIDDLTSVFASATDMRRYLYCIYEHDERPDSIPVDEWRIRFVNPFVTTENVAKMILNDYFHNNNVTVAGFQRDGLDKLVVSIEICEAWRPHLTHANGVPRLTQRFVFTVTRDAGTACDDPDRVLQIPYSS